MAGDDRPPTRKRRPSPGPDAIADEPPVTRASYADERPSRPGSYTEDYGTAVESTDSYVSYQPIDPEPSDEDWDRYADQASRPPLDLSPKDDEDSDARFSEGTSDDRYDDFDRPVKFER